MDIYENSWVVPREPPMDTHENPMEPHGIISHHT